jgi:uncharacterized protein YecT (DUF1311 family)
MSIYEPIRFISLASALLCIASQVPAADGDYIFAAKQKTICSRGGQQQMNQCMAKEFRKVDQELNTLYKKLTNVLADPKGIRNAQRAWLRFRDAQCSDDVMQLGSGSLDPYAYYSCVIEFSQERIRHLRWHLAQDCNGCPVRK